MNQLHRSQTITNLNRQKAKELGLEIEHLSGSRVYVLDREQHASWIGRPRLLGAILSQYEKTRVMPEPVF